jgi:hypothetical protein
MQSCQCLANFYFQYPSLYRANWQDSLSLPLPSSSAHKLANGNLGLPKPHTSSYMVQLEHTKIMRGGSERAPDSLNTETYECSFTTHINKSVRAFDFEFKLSSGPGYSAVLLRVGLDDLTLMLQEIARETREQKFKVTIQAAD